MAAFNLLIIYSFRACSMESQIPIFQTAFWIIKELKGLSESIR